MSETKLTHAEKLDRYLGRGKYALTREQYMNRKPCKSCNGSGYSNEPNRCGACNGSGCVVIEDNPNA